MINNKVEQCVTHIEPLYTPADLAKPYNLRNHRIFNERHLVKEIADVIGHGRLFQVAQQLWAADLAINHMDGGEFAFGPCVANTVICGCEYEPKNPSNSCRWCCGAGWLTKHVREVQIAQSEGKQ